MNFQSNDRLTTERLKRLAWLLDSSIRLPGGIRAGIDGIIGLVPGVGDLVGSALAAYIVIAAARLGVPPSVLARMVFNVAVDAVVGAVPLFGDLFDIGWKANIRNVKLLEAYQQDPGRTVVRSRVRVVLAGLVLLLLWTAVSVMMFALFRWLWQQIPS